MPWKEFFTALKEIGYTGPLVIESFDPSFTELSRSCAIWRKFADSGESLAVQGLKNLKRHRGGSLIMSKMRVAIDCDDTGSSLKAVLVPFLRGLDVEVADLNYSGGKAQAMYPEIGWNLAGKVREAHSTGAC